MKTISIFIILSCLLFLACNSDEKIEILEGANSKNTEESKSIYGIYSPIINEIWDSGDRYNFTCLNAVDFIQVQYFSEGTSQWTFYTISNWSNYKHPVDYNGRGQVSLEKKKLPRGDFMIRIRTVTEGESYSDWSEPKDMPHNYYGFFPELPDLQIPDDGHSKSLLRVYVKFPSVSFNSSVSVIITGDCTGEGSVNVPSGEMEANLDILIDTSYEFNLEVKAPSSIAKPNIKKFERCIVSTVRQTMWVNFN